MRIYIVGFMGSGKSDYGKTLANILNFPFIDTDLEIENKTGHSIKSLFSQNGERFFRKMEFEVIKETIFKNNAIISTGGGLPAFSDNMDFMVKNGITVFLKPPFGEILLWLAQNKENRPLIQDKDGEELAVYLQNLYQERLPYYRRSHFIISPVHTSPELFSRILKL
jgi:shikimate kinase